MSESPLPGPHREGLPKEGMEFADASLWLSRIFSVVAPGLIGLWLDDRYGTRYFALVGLVLGLVSGVSNFVQVTKETFKKPVGEPPSGKGHDQTSPDPPSRPGQDLK